MRLSFLRDLGLVSASEAVVGVSAFLYAMIVSRSLGVADYGLFQAVMAVYSVLTVFVSPLSLATVHCVAVSDDGSRAGVIAAFLASLDYWALG